MGIMMIILNSKLLIESMVDLKYLPHPILNYAKILSFANICFIIIMMHKKIYK